MTVEGSDRVGLLAEQLLAVLRCVTGEAALAYADPPTPLTGGFWAELISFRLTDPPDDWPAALVGRIMPDAGVAAKETSFQAAVAAQGFSTPKVRASGRPADGVDSRAYMVMDLVTGRPLLAGLDGLGALTKLPSLARHLPTTLATVMAALHALDPAPAARRLDDAAVPYPGLPAMLASLHDTAEKLGRADLVAAATWLQGHRAPEEPIVVCHGDLHPFNVVVDDVGAVTVLDWSAALLAPATYDVAFTSLVLAEPPLVAPKPFRPLIRTAGRALSRRFVRAYEGASSRLVDQASLGWHQAVVCLRALVEVAGWVAADTIDERGGHPWVIAGPAFAARLRMVTGAPVTPR